MNISRILRHLFASPLAVRRIFPATALTAIEQAIRKSEARHRGEILFAVEAALNTVSLLRGQPARERAIEVFSQLRMWDTEHNNGVLIYLLLADRDVEIIADRGIDARVGSKNWEKICSEMETAFHQGQFESGIIAGIQAIGNHLQEHFPAEPETRENALSDRPVIL